jgi:hypothetical protein
MIASVHIADVGARTALAALRKAPRPSSVPGLRHADIGLTAPLSKSVLPSPQLGRVGLIAFWDDEYALDRFQDSHPLAERLAGGWQVRLEPLRLFGSWPGVPDDIPQTRTVEHEGATAVLTLGRLRLTQAPRFLRTSAKAEAAVVGAAGLTWATGLARPPFVATCSLWQSTNALSTYAYGHSEPAHTQAIHAQETKPFHHQSAFIRFRPLSSHGSLDGKNPLTGE